MKSIISLCVLIMVGNVLLAQSYHFSQFFSTPLLTNPANTGFTDGPYRIASNFRSQGMAGGSPYFTGYVSADFSPLQSSLPQGHKAGGGVYLMNDKSLNGGLQTNTMGLSTAYHVGLDENGEKSLGLGLQGTYSQRRIDYSKLTFGNQFGSAGFDEALPIGEALNFDSRNYFDVNAGLVYNVLMEDRAFFGGVSIYNIIRHKDNFVQEEFQMPTRYNVQAGGQIFVGEYGKAYFSVTHMRQAKANETTVGGAYGIQLTDDGTKNEVNFGMWYRYKDALIPYIGYQNNGFQVGLSFDYTVSSARTANQVRNGYELTLLYSAIDKSKLKTLIPWY